MDKFNSWSKSFDSISLNPNKKKVGRVSKYLITYHLDLAFHSEGCSQLIAFKSRVLKNGALSTSSRTRIGFFNLSSFRGHEDSMNSEDYEIFSLYLHFYNDIDRQFKPIEGSSGYTLMQKLIESNRFYLIENNQPLCLKKNRLELDLLWRENPVGFFNLEKNLNPNLTLINTVPILAIDPSNNSVFEVTQDIRPDICTAFLNAPGFLNTHEVLGIYRKLFIRGFRTEDLPRLPPSLDIFESHSPKFSITVIKYDDTDSDYYLAFETSYGGHCIDYFPRKNISIGVNGKLFHRDLSAEEKARKLIKTLKVSEDIQSNKIFFDTPDYEFDNQEWAEFWHHFIYEFAPAVEEKGWEIKYKDYPNIQFNSKSNISISSEPVSSWFEMSFEIEINGEKKSLLDILTVILNRYGSIDKLPEQILIGADQNNFARIEKKLLMPFLSIIQEMYDRKTRSNSIKIYPYDAHFFSYIDKDIEWKGNSKIKELSKKLGDFNGITHTPPSPSLNCVLRDYQQIGLDWINFLHEYGFGGILADDMGLGKTLQSISFINKLKHDGNLSHPALIVVPTTLITNWKNEIRKFSPSLNVLVLHGPERDALYKKIKTHDVIIIPFSILSRDSNRHKRRKYSCLIVDEATNIKNPKTKMAKAVFQIKADFKLALSGTPIENHLGELWSLFNFLMPGFLKNQSAFRKFYQNPIEKKGDFEKQSLLNTRINPFILRRTKDEVLAELPPKSIIKKVIPMNNEQITLYESIRVTLEKKVKESVSVNGLSKSHITILDAILKLRQICCHPQLLKLESAKGYDASAKLTYFLDLVDELMSQGSKVLVFSQFASMIQILERELIKKGVSCAKLTGATRKRDQAIEKFTSGNASVFLISIKAGGTGLNLTEADTVIHYDPWWNPAVENQATDRAHRIGQNKAVFVYKLIMENSIEEKVLQLQKKKQLLQDGIYSDGLESKEKKVSGDELLTLLQQ